MVSNEIKMNNLNGKNEVVILNPNFVREKIISYVKKSGGKPESKLIGNGVDELIKKNQEGKLSICCDCGYFNESCGVGCRDHNGKMGVYQRCSDCRTKGAMTDHARKHWSSSQARNDANGVKFSEHVDTYILENGEKVIYDDVPQHGAVENMRLGNDHYLNCPLVAQISNNYKV